VSSGTEVGGAGLHALLTGRRESVEMRGGSMCKNWL
jgi:hypothetical protein